MQIELEAKFVDVKRETLRYKLEASGYMCEQEEALMRRVVFDIPGKEELGAWARVRDEANRITVSYKRTHDITKVDGTEEIEIEVNSFEQAIALLEAFGLQRKSYQETRREIWRWDEIEVTIDEWPGLYPICEIEAPTEEALQQVAIELGFDWEDALFGPIGAVYELIGIPQDVINAFPRLTFDNVAEILALAEDQPV